MTTVEQTAPSLSHLLVFGRGIRLDGTLRAGDASYERAIYAAQLAHTDADQIQEIDFLGGYSFMERNIPPVSEAEAMRSVALQTHPDIENKIRIGTTSLTTVGNWVEATTSGMITLDSKESLGLVAGYDQMPNVAAIGRLFLKHAQLTPIYVGEKRSPTAKDRISGFLYGLALRGLDADQPDFLETVAAKDALVQDIIRSLIIRDRAAFSRLIGRAHNAVV